MEGQDKTEEKRDDTSNEINQIREILCYYKREKGKKERKEKKKAVPNYFSRNLDLFFFSI